MRQAVFILPNIAKKERKRALRNDELMEKILRNPVRISAERKDAAGSELEIRIEGSAIGVMTTSLILFERLAKIIGRSGYKALVVWSADITRILTSALSDIEGRSDADGKKE